MWGFGGIYLGDMEVFGSLPINLGIYGFYAFFRVENVNFSVFNIQMKEHFWGCEN